MAENRMDKIVKYGLLLVKDKKFLIAKEKGTDLFLMPGGRPEKNESPEECLIREIMEEIGCEVIRKSIKFFGEFEDIAVNDPGKLVNIKLYTADVKGKPKANSEIEELKWFGRGDDAKVLSPLIKNKILPAVLEKGLLG